MFSSPSKSVNATTFALSWSRSSIFFYLLIVCDSCSRSGSLQQQATPEHPTQLELTVSPQVGISIILNQKRVADRSPYTSEYLKVGDHQLLIRAMGHHPYEQIVTIAPDSPQVLALNIALRGKDNIPPPQRFSEPELKPKSHDGREEEPEREQERSRPSQPGMAPWQPKVDRQQWQQRERVLATLLAVPEPKVPLWLDGSPVDGKILRLNQRKGRLRAGPLTLRYHINEAGEVQLFIPDDGSTWSTLQAPLLPGTILSLTNAATRILRQEGQEAGQSLLLKLQGHPTGESNYRAEPQ